MTAAQTNSSSGKLIITGGSGFLGQALVGHFTKKNWEVVVLTRRPSDQKSPAREVVWDGEALGAWAGELEGATAVVNLCGRSVDCRYTAANRRIIVDSRVQPTRMIGEAIARCQRPPLTWLNASSATIYRHTLGEPWDESCTDFSATAEARDAFSIDVIHAWERELDIANTPQTRKVRAAHHDGPRSRSEQCIPRASSPRASRTWRSHGQRPAICVVAA